METININKIQADETQARKHFDAEKLKMLKESVRRDGIINPLLLEKIGDNYLIIDGERRYRVAKELGLKDVPATVEKTHSKSERLVRRFTVQEQHESWTPIEKANALIELSEELGLTINEVCKLLNISWSDTRRYVAFAELVDKAAWVRSGVPLSLSEFMKTLRNTARRIYETEFKEEFKRNDEKLLEHRVIDGIMDGSIKRRSDVTKLNDAIIKDPKNLKKFLGDKKLTVQKLFLDSGAQGANALRNTVYNSAYIYTHGQRFLSSPDVKLTDDQITTMKRAKDTLTKIISLAD
jgi:ParB/RepB/Spo0J family partition protein